MLNIVNAIPWLLFAATLVVLLAASVGLLLDRRDLRRADDEIDRLTTENESLTNHAVDLAQDLARTRGERDLARDTVRGLLDAQRDGFVRLRPRADNSMTEEFTKIVERNSWPKPGAQS